MDIFLLEDDSAIGIGLSYSLKNEGYGVSVAKTVKEALKKKKKKSFSIFYQMPLKQPQNEALSILISKLQTGYMYCR